MFLHQVQFFLQVQVTYVHVSPFSLIGTNLLKDHLVVLDNGGYSGPLHDSGRTAECGCVSLRELHFVRPAALVAALAALLLPEVHLVGVL